MSIELSILPHQNDFLKAVRKAFEDIRVMSNEDIHQNSIIDLDDNKIKENINDLWNGYQGLQKIPMAWRTRDDDDYLGIDIRMETGTGKTYCYTRMMYELNEMYGFNKFILLVPSTSIKEGSKSFLKADYSNRHFSDLYPNKSLKLSILEPQKKTKGRKMFPDAISEFARGTSLEKNRFSVLLMTSGMLLSNATMAKDDYDQTILGNFSQPYETLRATRPIVIIDEPHRFKKENQAYQRILKELHPQCIIRFGATFPDKKSSKGKDYNNLIFNLGPNQAFNQNLVKGVETFMIDAERKNETKLKLMDFKRSPKLCTFRDEMTKKPIELSRGDNLSKFGEEFSGITIEEIGPTSDDAIKSGVTLSNGQILAKGDVVYGGIYTETYQELMLKQSIVNHLETEKKNFLRGNKIKTLSLYFIDSVRSYREKDDRPGHLRIKFESMLSDAFKKEIRSIGNTKDQRLQEYKSYLESSLVEISKTNGGYFSDDDSTSDKDIQKEVDKILRNKEALLNFHDETGRWNTMRFIFSKWTLKEGWDNPNVFQIVKLRSSGSEISKLQEVGRGLRLPVDEKGRRIADEQFYLRYLIDYSEKDFASKLLGEIQADTPGQSMNIKKYLTEIAKIRNKSENEIFGELLMKQYIDYDGNIQLEKIDDLYVDYPEAVTGLKPNKVIDGNKKKNFVKVRQDKFDDISDLWKNINRKYYLKFENISDEELSDAFYNVLKSDIYIDTTIDVKTRRTVSKDGEIVLRERVANYYLVDDKVAYRDFLKEINRQTGISAKIVHKTLCKYNDEQGKIDNRLFTNTGIALAVREFNRWLDEKLLKKLSYKPLDVDSKETSLTDYNGNVLEQVSQGILGIHRDDTVDVPERFIYDSVVYDSPKERQTLLTSDIDEVVVFGKIPRKSIQIPLFTGGTTSPDFMYVINSEEGGYEMNFVVETKDMDNDKGLRRDEEYRIKSAERFFKTLKNEGLNVVFKKQLRDDDIVAMIKGISRN
ncbi:type III restriction-modification system endonuclease [Staphylococcus lutrae]|uniref:Type III deoxyribonuclease n=3 Tax=Staphylococcus lutrae TaxID=155085 RepID=A0AAC9RNG2_9STAP|nr:type III restriction-modification system endonuclease [Staphylococcus lutrae]ARJ50361.1 type III deoxyribonuclease [Staphylococcus lutrae]